MICTSLRPTGVPLRLRYEKSAIIPPSLRLDVLGGYKDPARRLFILCRSQRTEEWPAYDMPYRLEGQAVLRVGTEDEGYLDESDRITFGRLGDYDPFKLDGKVYRKVSSAELRSKIAECEYRVQ